MGIPVGAFPCDRLRCKPAVNHILQRQILLAGNQPPFSGAEVTGKKVDPVLRSETVRIQRGGLP